MASAAPRNAARYPAPGRGPVRTVIAGAALAVAGLLSPAGPAAASASASPADARAYTAPPAATRVPDALPQPAPGSQASAAPAAAPAPPATPRRPRVAVVLSGGGARGYAHLGVLKVLEAHRIPVDIVTGTSMGAVVGGLYASGLSANELIQRLEGVDLTSIAFDRTERAEQPQSVREDEFQYPIGLSAGFGNGQLRMPAGLVAGNRFLYLMQEWTSRIPGSIDFDDLPIPFRAMATDVENGNGVVLADGSLPLAMRASMAVPGLFSPIERNGRMLVDGALAANMPVQLAQDMGADVVIAIDISSPLLQRDELSSIGSITQQVVGILMSRNMVEQRALLRPQDFLLQPELGRLAFTDFGAARTAIDAGIQSAEQAMPRLRHLALPPAEYAALLAARANRIGIDAPGRIDRIAIRTHGAIPATQVRRMLELKEGDTYDVGRVNKAMQALSTSGHFESVRQNFVSEGGQQVLQIDAHEKSWGPHFLLFGMSLSTHLDGDGAYRLDIGHRRPWLTPSGLEWRNDVQIGSDILRLHSELRQPWPRLGGLFVAPYMELERRNLSFYPDDDDDVDDRNQPYALYRVSTYRLGLDVGIPLGRLGEWRVGPSLGYVRGKPRNYLPNYGDIDDDSDTFQNLLPAVKLKQQGIRSRIVLDQLDDPVFPRSGYYLSLENEISLQNDDRYNQARLKAIYAHRIGRHSLNVALEAGGYLGDHDDDRESAAPTLSLGGFQRLSAYNADQFSGRYLLYGRVTYLTPITTYGTSLFKQMLAGASVEIGNVWNKRHEFGGGHYRHSLSLFGGFTSSIGPIYFGYAYAPGSQHNVYIQLGRPF